MREFLTYLEDKKIINTDRLEKNKDEMNNLIKDLMKLDLSKFSKPRSYSNNRKTSPAAPSERKEDPKAFAQRHNSASLQANQSQNFVFGP